MSVGGEESDEFEEEEEENVASVAAKGAYQCLLSQQDNRLVGSSNPRRMMERGASGGADSLAVLNSFHQGNGNSASSSSRDALGHSYYTTLLTGNFNEQSLSTIDQSLKQILSDPVSGELMDDAVIFPCGHSFGNAGVQKIQETSLCPTCQTPTRCRDGALNLGLRAAVQAYRLDRELPKSGSSRAAKRRRDPDGEQAYEGGRPKGVQFPYVVSDRVLIKGNKRTPERFVGKQAIITTQCLNGWYLVRTLDNGESVRLQYRSLEKIES